MESHRGEHSLINIENKTLKTIFTMKRIILLVEDNLEALPLARKALLNVKKCKDVVIAKDYDEAIELLENNVDIGFVITDLFFPKKTGSGEITLGLDLLNQAKQQNQKEKQNQKKKQNQQTNLNLTTWIRSNGISDLQRNIPEDEHLQPLGILIAKKAIAIGKKTLLVSAMSDRYRTFLAVDNLIRKNKISNFEDIDLEETYKLQEKLQKRPINSFREVEMEIANTQKKQPVFWERVAEKVDSMLKD